MEDISKRFSKRANKYKVESPAEYLEVEETTRLSFFILASITVALHF